jgi:hypothetical protein
MACKSCINDLGEFPHNEDITLDDVMATVEGEHAVRLDFAGNIRYIKVELSPGDPVVIPKGKLNEDATYEFTVVDPDGENLLLDECANFRLKTFIANDGNCSPDSCNDLVGDGDGYA